eukprot:2875566-Pleurochrysis_carterae.AAC.3
MLPPTSTSFERLQCSSLSLAADLKQAERATSKKAGTSTRSAKLARYFGSAGVAAAARRHLRSFAAYSSLTLRRRATARDAFEAGWCVHALKPASTSETQQSSSPGKTAADSYSFESAHAQAARLGTLALLCARAENRLGKLETTHERSVLKIEQACTLTDCLSSSIDIFAPISHPTAGRATH